MIIRMRCPLSQEWNEWGTVTEFLGWSSFASVRRVMLVGIFSLPKQVKRSYYPTACSSSNHRHVPVCAGYYYARLDGIQMKPQLWS